MPCGGFVLSAGSVALGRCAASVFEGLWQRTHIATSLRLSAMQSQIEMTLVAIRYLGDLTPGAGPAIRQPKNTRPYCPLHTARPSGSWSQATVFPCAGLPCQSQRFHARRWVRHD